MPKTLLTAALLPAPPDRLFDMEKFHWTPWRTYLEGRTPEGC